MNRQNRARLQPGVGYVGRGVGLGLGLESQLGLGSGSGLGFGSDMRAWLTRAHAYARAYVVEGHLEVERQLARERAVGDLHGVLLVLKLAADGANGPTAVAVREAVEDELADEPRARLAGEVQRALEP